MVYAILIAYFALTFFIGIIATRRPDLTPESFFLADRGLKTVALFFTLIATNFSAFFFLGFAGEGYRIGYAYYAIMAFGTAYAALNFYIIGNKAWHLGKKNGYITPIEMMGDLSGSEPLRIVYMIVMVGFIVPFLAIQPIGAGLILENLTGGDIPYALGASLLTLFIILYVFIGGMRSIAMLDIKNGVLMLLFMTGAAAFVVTDLGGLISANRELFERSPEFFTPSGKNDYYTPLRWFSYAVLWATCLPMFPQIFTRFLMSKDLKTFKKTTVLYTLIPPFLFILPVMIGVLGHLSHPGLEGKEADGILPMMLISHSPRWMGALVLTGALAAFMSTMDSILLALSTISSRDVYLHFFKPGAGLKLQVRAGQISVIIFALIALGIAIVQPTSIFNIAKMTFSGSAMLFPTTVAIFYLKGVRPWTCVLSIVSGVLLVVSLYSGWIHSEWLGGMEPVLPAILLATVIILVGNIGVSKRQ